MDIKLLLAHFFIGGIVVTAITYYGSRSQGMVAAFIAFLPSISVITIAAIYLRAGQAATLDYAKSMLLLVPSWILYIVLFIILLPRIGLAPSLTVSVLAYLLTALLIARIF